jgi:hypothetical protein|tara:strand:+ start:4002 stop:4271 length:270 start_codon:yes stop_codon:yes gene_type:complete
LGDLPEISRRCFATCVKVQAEGLIWLAGQAQQCSLTLGSLQPWPLFNPGYWVEEPDRPVDNSIFCASRPDWSANNRDIPEYDRWPKARN